MDRNILSLMDKGRDRHQHTKTKYRTGDSSAVKSTLCSYRGPGSVQNTRLPSLFLKGPWSIKVRSQTQAIVMSRRRLDAVSAQVSSCTSSQAGRPEPVCTENSQQRASFYYMWPGTPSPSLYKITFLIKILVPNILYDYRQKVKICI